MYAILAIVVTLLLLLGTHEAGHACAARLFSIKIIKVAVGFGRSLLSYKSKSEIEWVWGLWPLGGYVQLSSTRANKVKATEISYCFDKKPIWIRCIVLLAGSFSNFFTAFIGLVIFFSLGFQQNVPIIKYIDKHSIADKSGFQAGDKIIEVNRKAVNSWQMANMYLLGLIGEKKMMITVQHVSGYKEHMYADLTHFSNKKPALWENLGIQPDYSYIQHIPGVSILPAISSALLMAVNYLYFYLILVKQLILGHLPFIFLLGPIGVIDVVINSFTQGISMYCGFIAVLSIAVGVFNLFPIPGLDGGSLLYLAIEKMRGKPMTVAFEYLLLQLAQILYFLIIVQLVMNDIFHFIQYMLY